MLLNVLCVVIWYATNINWSTRVRTSYRVNTKWTRAPPTTVTQKLIREKRNRMKNRCMGNSTQNYAQIRNKAQTITCALPKLNTKSPYILNTTPTTAHFFCIFLEIFILQTIVLCVSVWLGRFRVIRIRFVWPPFVATQISRFFAIGFEIFPSVPFSFICSVFNFRCAFICTFVSHQNCLVCAWYFRCFEPWFCVAYFACRQWYALSVATCHRFFFFEIHNQIYTHRNGKNEKQREKTDRRRIEWMIEWDRYIQEGIRSQKLSLVDGF